MCGGFADGMRGSIRLSWPRILEGPHTTLAKPAELNRYDDRDLDAIAGALESTTKHCEPSSQQSAGETLFQVLLSL